MDNLIKNFKIIGLFECQDINLYFDGNEMILVGENGSGKSTVLSILAYTLKGEFRKLDKYNFNSVELEFISGEIISFTKFDLEQLPIDNDKSRDIDSLPRIRRRIASTILNKNDLRIVFKDIIDNKINKKQITSDYLSKRLGFKGHHFETKIKQDFLKLLNNQEPFFDEIKQKLDRNLNGIEVLYFPTYRRVEEDLNNLELMKDNIEIESTRWNKKENEIKIRKLPIKFGMQDVNDRFDLIKSEIGRISTKGLNNLSSDMLKQLIRGNTVEKPEFTEFSKNDVEIVIERLGGIFDKADKAKILTLMIRSYDSNQITDNLSMYFLSKLVEIYEEQKNIDIYTDKFISVCNTYLEQTELVFDKIAVDIYALSKKSKSRIELGLLSSGEQQIVSMFSQIYLNKDKKFILLFDEPELSLSMFWQLKLLPDLIDSGKICLLLAVTHSPFIYDNNLRYKTYNLSDFATEVNVINVEVDDVNIG